MINLYNQDNMAFETEQKFSVIYCDYIYQNLDLSFVDKFWPMLDKNSLFMAQTDDSSMAQMKLKLDSMPNSIFINTCIQVQDWGGTPKKGFPKKHDYIFIYANGEDFKWYKDRIQVEKSTRNTAFDKKGTGLKTPCDVFFDIPNFSTMANERIKGEDGKNIRWQKSLAVINRLMLPVTDEEDWILDPFAGVMSVGDWCIKNNRNYVGLELDNTIFNLGKNRLNI